MVKSSKYYALRRAGKFAGGVGKQLLKAGWTVGKGVAKAAVIRAVGRGIGRLTGKRHKGPSGGSATKLLKKEIKGDDIHSGVSGEVVVVNIGGRKKYRKTRGGPLKSVGISSDIPSSLPGNQNIKIVCQKGTVDDWLNTTNNSGVGDVQFGGWFAMDPYQLDTGSVTYTGTAVLPAGYTATQAMMHCMDVNRIMICNETTAGQYHELYVVECIRNASEGPIVMWENGLARQGGGLTAIVQPGAGGVGVPAPGYLNAGIVGTYPTESREFNRFYKIRKVKKVYLAAGATEEIKFVCKVNQTYTKEYIGKLKDEGIIYPRGSYVIFNVSHGAPVVDVTGGAKVVTYAGIEYAFITNCTTHLKSVDMRRKNAITYGYSTIATNSLLTKQVNAVDVISTVAGV